MLAQEYAKFYLNQKEFQTASFDNSFNLSEISADYYYYHLNLKLCRK